ncbi:MAG TPA: citrate/2-methylcitrate synthase, partial [Chitinophagales bacterium]|nr:citrate/2-methylcitrate synthase [Chitinophagales bacterium]
MSDNNVTVQLEGKEINLPVIVGTENEKAIDIAQLRSESGYVTLDPGYKNTGATKSAITFLNGEDGVLRYRGYGITELAEKSTFTEVSYLLLNGELPSSEQLAEFESSLAEKSQLPIGFNDIQKAFPSKAHPMTQLAAAISLLESYSTGDSSAVNNENINTVIGGMSSIAANIQRHFTGQGFVTSSSDKGFVHNFLTMAFGEEPNDIVVDAMDKLLILHADHEQNCSTSTVRMVGSSHVGLFASLSAGISALWGPLHGGANQAVIEMLEAIREDGGDTHRYMAKAKDKDDPFRLMGFGHRVYKNFDPRAKIIKKSADQVLEALGIQDEVLDIAKGLEKEALEDSYFVDRKLYPNVDFYSGIIYRALGIPEEMFTAMF